jgi:3-dehydroquinate synthase
VKAGGEARDYEVLVGRGLLAELPELLADRVPAHRWVIIADETVARLYADPLRERLSGPRVEPLLLRFPAGEEHKTRGTWANLTDAMLAAGCGRDAAVLAIGGGVTGDLAGFVAATYLRGIPVVQVPTSLVAMIDSAVGGKTGVDTKAGKNLVGAFHPPKLVVVDPEATATLSRPQRAQGLVEAVKHGAIMDARYFEALEDDLPALLDGEPAATEAAVLRSVEIKAAVVAEDEREGDYRQILNFGHTVGHALEAASGYGLSHGESVALGMVLEARLGERLGVTRAGTADRLEGAVRALGLASRPAPDTDVSAVLSFLGADKKRRAGRARYVLLAEVGRVARGEGWSRTVDDDFVRALLD